LYEEEGNKEEAKRYYKLAADQGNADAQRSLRIMAEYEEEEAALLRLLGRR
jgi:TPR repeat protein